MEMPIAENNCRLSNSRFVSEKGLQCRGTGRRHDPGGSGLPEEQGGRLVAPLSADRPFQIPLVPVAAPGRHVAKGALQEAAENEDHHGHEAKGCCNRGHMNI